MHQLKSDQSQLILLKMITILKEIAQLCSKNERTLVHDFFLFAKSIFSRPCGVDLKSLLEALSP
jgi:hypothetical protein